MDSAIRIEIQNRTRYPLTWAHLDTEGERPGQAPINLLDATLPPRRGRVIDGGEAGVKRLVCGLHTEGRLEQERIVSRAFTLEAGTATSACLLEDREGEISLTWHDARASEDGEGRPAGPYRWNGRRGRRTPKQETAR